VFCLARQFMSFQKAKLQPQMKEKYQNGS